MSIVAEIKGVASSKYSTGALYAFIGGLILSDALPTPADGLYFTYQRKLREQYIKKEITPAEYWRRDAISYYLFNVGWWALVGAVVIATKGTAEQKLKVASVIIGGGVVLGVLHQNIVKDEKQQQIEKIKK